MEPANAKNPITDVSSFHRVLGNRVRTPRDMSRRRVLGVDTLLGRVVVDVPVRAAGFAVRDEPGVWRACGPRAGMGVGSCPAWRLTARDRGVDCTLPDSADGGTIGGGRNMGRYIRVLCLLRARNLAYSGQQRSRHLRSAGGGEHRANVRNRSNRRCGSANVRPRFPSMAKATEIACTWIAPRRQSSSVVSLASEGWRRHCSPGSSRYATATGP